MFWTGDHLAHCRVETALKYGSFVVCGRDNLAWGWQQQGTEGQSPHELIEFIITDCKVDTLRPFELLKTLLPQ